MEKNQFHEKAVNNITYIGVGIAIARPRHFRVLPYLSWSPVYRAQTLLEGAFALFNVAGLIRWHKATKPSNILREIQCHAFCECAAIITASPA